MMIQDFLARGATSNPDAILLLDGAERATYRHVEAASNQMARLLVDLGIRRGDRVVLQAPNALRYVVSYFGVLKAGAIAVPLHVTSDSRTLAAVIGDCAASAVIAGPGALARVAEAAAEATDLRTLIAPEADVPAVSWPARIHVVSETAASSFPGAWTAPSRFGREGGASRL
jgi:long-chain acyl-CoA synthetase